ncbi:histidinol-phosphate transaminase [Paracoccus aerodenitrificans]|uniref:histidinol-phosphate transaminase n=1 Tax=Paracoccus aerodenitrificans TaxID=3017781 RepID=UPI0022F10714|nr:histidinol-phosphate transaminase [Paracoccus aerodenitrificans]WBU63078.1 histidinol-phosphate transaminase [Paracoccus aerodenitrificans]
MSDQPRIPPQPGIMDISLYQGGAAHIAGQDNVIKLSSNENPYGASEKAREAAIRAAHQMHRYPNTDHAALREAIAEIHGLDPDRIICGAGSDEVLQFAAQCFAGPGDEIIMTEHGFSMYPILTRAAGATPVVVPERQRKVDVDAILNAVTAKTRIVFLTNPGNPTGTLLPEAGLRRLVSGLPDDVLLVHDGAYTEFIDGEFRLDFDLADTFPNLMATRTFSKIYGLGGLRIGWGYAQRSLIDVLNRVRQPFNLSVVQLAAAEAAMRDRAHVTRCQAENARWRGWLREALQNLGIDCDESHANFVLARFSDEATATACDEALKADGVIVRKVAGYGLPNCLRITIGDESSCRRVAHVVGLFMAERGLEKEDQI